MSQQPKQHVSFRMAKPGVQWLDSLKDEGVDRTDVIRAALRVAKRYESEVKKELGR